MIALKEGLEELEKKYMKILIGLVLMGNISMALIDLYFQQNFIFLFHFCNSIFILIMIALFKETKLIENKNILKKMTELILICLVLLGGFCNDKNPLFLCTIFSFFFVCLYTRSFNRSFIYIFLVLLLISLVIMLRNRFFLVKIEADALYYIAVDIHIVLFSCLYFITFLYYTIEIKKLEALLLYLEEGKVRIEPFYFINNTQIEDSINRISEIENTILKDLPTYSKLYEDIEFLMQTQKPWKDSEYNLEQLTKDVNSNVVYVSTSINKFAQMNLKSYLNEYRLNAFMEKIEDIKTKKSSIKEVFYSVGFSNQATFNRVFKTKYNKNPNEYINSLS